jgi:hypothetical protein
MYERLNVSANDARLSGDLPTWPTPMPRLPCGLRLLFSHSIPIFNIERPQGEQLFNPQTNRSASLSVRR